MVPVSYLWGPSPLDNLRYVFTRNVVGPMDYTPLIFELPYEQQKITYGHSLALSVIFESLTTLC